ncbi:MFS transporter [Loigolactobacillus zhaoyuanensis]|uniref:MFS transporter n=1 Tax=Loigolactobacillus zhaoyuanensis TaxID=2486017 RepID=A0ABW8UA57_9LACO
MQSAVKRWTMLAVIGLFFFMVIVDGSIVAIAIPDIARDLAITTGATTLIISSYLITICASLLLFGQIGDQFGRSRVFKWGTLIFLVGSFLAGSGGSLSIVLLGRFVQGIGASMTMANSYALVTDIFPPEQLGRAFGIEGIFISLGALAGPGLGGLILVQLPWNYIFWINLPLGLLCLIAEVAVFPKSQQRSSSKIDWLGAASLALATSALYLATMQLRYWWVMILLMVIFSYIFWRVESKIAVPLLDFKIFRYQLFSQSLLVAFLSFIVAYFFTILAPLYLQLVLQYSPGVTGLLLMVTPIVSLVASPLAGYISDRYDQRLEMTIGMAILVVAQLSLAFATARFEPTYFIFNSVLIAVGTALFGTPNNVIVMQAVPNKMRGLAGATNSLVREFGLVLGTTLSTLIFYRLLSLFSQRQVDTALGMARPILLKAQRGTYLVALLLLSVALFILIWHRKKELTSNGDR